MFVFHFRYPLYVRAEVAAGSLISRLNTLRANMRPKVPRSLGILGLVLLLPQYEYLTKCLHVPESMFAGMCGTMPDKTLSLVFITPEMRSFMQTRSTVSVTHSTRLGAICYACPTQEWSNSLSRYLLTGLRERNS